MTSTIADNKNLNHLDLLFNLLSMMHNEHRMQIYCVMTNFYKTTDVMLKYFSCLIKILDSFRPVLHKTLPEFYPLSLPDKARQVGLFRECYTVAYTRLLLDMSLVSRMKARRPTLTTIIAPAF